MEDFHKLISDVTATFKPQYDRSKLEDKDLLNFYCLYTVWSCQCVVRILGMMDEAPFTNETAKRVSALSHYPNPENLAYLYFIHPDKRPLEFLVRIKLEKRSILEELDQRHQALQAGRAFIAIDEGKWQGDMNDLHKVLKVEKIPSYRIAKEDPEDLKSIATTKAWAFFKRRGRSVVVKHCGP